VTVLRYAGHGCSVPESDGAERDRDRRAGGVLAAGTQTLACHDVPPVSARRRRDPAELAVCLSQRPAGDRERVALQRGHDALPPCHFASLLGFFAGLRFFALGFFAVAAFFRFVLGPFFARLAFFGCLRFAFPAFGVVPRLLFSGFVGFAFHVFLACLGPFRADLYAPAAAGTTSSTRTPMNTTSFKRMAAIMGTVSAHGTQAVSAVAAAESAAANQAVARADAAALFGELSLPAGATGSEALPGTSTTREPSLILRIDRVLGVKLKISLRHPREQPAPSF
jgi:hypothetical protein